MIVGGKEQKMSVSIMTPAGETEVPTRGRLSENWINLTIKFEFLH